VRYRLTLVSGYVRGRHSAHFAIAADTQWFNRPQRVSSLNRDPQASPQTEVGDSVDPFQLGQFVSANVPCVHEAPEPGNARRRGFHALPDLPLSQPAWQAREARAA
jgi:hypothetical protein